MKTRSKWIVGGAALIVVAAAAFFGLSRSAETQHFTAKAERGDINDVVEATGTINAVITVQVGSQVSGTIAKLNADFNSRVHKGDIVALIDPALFKGALLQATADLENAKANLVAAQANLEKAKAAMVQTKADYDRTVGLFHSGIMSQQQLDLAQANLNYTVIRSPIDGTVVARNVDVGQTVAASLQAPTIFTIAQDLSKMWVYAKTDESDVGNIKVGKPVTFKVDAFPKDTFHGTVSQVRMNATTVQSVVTYDTIIEFANPELKLFPGMTAYVTIPVATVLNAMKLPNTALRYKPPMSPEEIVAAYRRYGIEGGEREASSAGSGVVQAAGQTSTQTQSPPRTPKGDTAVVWKFHADHTMEPVKVSLGITDHAFTEVVAVVKGEL